MQGYAEYIPMQRYERIRM